MKKKYIKIACNKEGRPGYPTMMKAFCNHCSPGVRDCENKTCPFYSVSPRNPNKSKDDFGGADFSWLIKDEYVRGGKRERVELVNSGDVVKVYRRCDYYPKEYEEQD